MRGETIRAGAILVGVKVWHASMVVKILRGRGLNRLALAAGWRMRAHQARRTATAHVSAARWSRRARAAGRRRAKAAVGVQGRLRCVCVCGYILVRTATVFGRQPPSSFGIGQFIYIADTRPASPGGESLEPS